MIHEFGPYRLDPAAQLKRGREAVHLPPKEFALLCLLARLGGRVASHEVIVAEVWSGQPVTDQSVARCVYSLRRKLGEERNFVETVPKRGFRLSVPVRNLPGATAPRTVEKSARAAPRAYSHYLEALHEANRQEPASQERAVALLEEAVREDPEYAVALAAIAECRMYQSVRGYLLPADAGRLGVAACERALVLDPDLAPARAALGWFQGIIFRDTDRGLEIVEEALTADPSYARSHSYHAWLLRSIGRFEEAVDSARTAYRLDPHSLLTLHALAWTLFCAGAPEEALEMERRVRRDTPHVDAGHAYVALMAAYLGLLDEAVAAARDAARITGENPLIMTAVAYTFAVAGRTRDARALADEAAAAQLPRAPRGHLAMSYVALGDAERAIRLLREARRERCPFFLAARFDPRLGSLAGDPRVQNLFD